MRERTRLEKSLQAQIRLENELKDTVELIELAETDKDEKMAVEAISSLKKLGHAVEAARVDGLEGLSIGNLSAAIGMSKSGLYAHFGSKQELQLATVEAADQIFQEVVVQPALAAAPGLAQLVALCEAYFDYLQRRTFPGGCFFAAAALEMGTRPGPVKERVAAWESRFAALVAGLVTDAAG